MQKGSTRGPLHVWYAAPYSDVHRRQHDSHGSGSRDESRRGLSTRAEILEAYVFGSRARRDERPHSDVDIAVYVDPDRVREAPFGYDSELAADLMSALGTSRVDVVVLNGAPPLLYHRVLRGGIRILSLDLVATTRREGQALSRYCDYLPQLAKIERAAAARTRAGEFGK